MSCGIYKITNQINNKCYIGQSIAIEERWKREKSRAFQPSQDQYYSTLGKAFRKYGVCNFTFEILEECKIDQLDELEQKYIALYDSYFSGYNETLGGQNSGFGTSFKISKNQLLEIYDLLQHSKLSQNEIALMYGVGKDVISTINHGKSRRLPGYNYPLRDNSAKIKACTICGKPISPKATICIDCNKEKMRVSDRPNRTELKFMIRTLAFTTIGKKFNVSDNTIRKWCDSYNLPRTKKEIKTYSEQEWELI